MESHLLQMRGLKRHSDGRTDRKRKVASFTDAWIETLIQRLLPAGCYHVASFTDAWIETLC